MPHDVIKEIANKLMATKREDNVDFNTAFTTVMLDYPNYNLASTKSAVGSELGRRNKGKKRQPKKQPRQAELPFGISRSQALKDAREHEESLTAGLPEHDL